MMRGVSRVVVGALRSLARVRGSARLVNAGHRTFGPRQPIVTVRRRGGTLELDLRQSMERAIFYGRYERDELAFLERWLRPGDTFVDVGANIGLFTIAASRRVGPTGAIHAIEPSPKAAERLRKHLTMNGIRNTTVHEVALLDANGEAEITIGVESGHSSLVHQPSGSDRLVIQTLAAPAFFRDLGVNPRLVKVDVEGSEPKLLPTLTRLLASTPDCALLIELDPALLEMAGTSRVAVLADAHAAGLRSFDVGRRGALRELDAPGGANVVLMRG